MSPPPPLATAPPVDCVAGPRWPPQEPHPIFSMVLVPWALISGWAGSHALFFVLMEWA